MGKRHGDILFKSIWREQTHEKCSSLAIKEIQIHEMHNMHLLEWQKIKKGKRVKTSNGEEAQELAGENVMAQPVS